MNKKCIYIVRADNSWLYWNNEYGWVRSCDAQAFTALEGETLRLPMGGAWTASCRDGKESK